MKLDPDRLEKVRRRGSKITARCPACAEMEQDRTGDHLAIFADGGFACVVCPQDRAHARRIQQLAGSDEFQRDSHSSFSTPVRRQKPVQDALPQDFAAMPARPVAGPQAAWKRRNAWPQSSASGRRPSAA